VKNSYNPSWREVITFDEMFPPLCNRIKVQLCDHNPIKDDIIGTHFIDLAQIMDPGGDSEGEGQSLCCNYALEISTRQIDKLF